MAHSYVHLPASAGQTLFNVTFDYLDRTHVKVKVNGVETTNFTWINDGQIDLTTPCVSGDLVWVYRETPIEARLVDFVSSSILTEQALDLDSEQLLFLLQEAFDRTADSLEIDPYGRLDAGGRVITNLGTPQGQSDAISYGWVTTALESPVTQAQDAAAQALASKRMSETYYVGTQSVYNTVLGIQNTLETIEDTTDTNRAAAELAASNASGSETAAGLSETAAAASETAAGLSEVSAGLSEVAAAASETAAQTIVDDFNGTINSSWVQTGSELATVEVTVDEVVPDADLGQDLGTALKRWGALYVGTVNIDTLNVTDIEASGTITGDTIVATTDVQSPLVTTSLLEAGVINGKLKGVVESLSEPINVAGQVALDLDNGRTFLTTITGSSQVSFTNIPTDECVEWTLVMAQSNPASSVSFPSGVKWPNGIAPDLTTSDGSYLFKFLTEDNGTTVYCTVFTSYDAPIAEVLEKYVDGVFYNGNGVTDRYIPASFNPEAFFQIMRPSSGSDHCFFGGPNDTDMYQIYTTTVSVATGVLTERGVNWYKVTNDYRVNGVGSQYFTEYMDLPNSVVTTVPDISTEWYNADLGISVIAVTPGYHYTQDVPHSLGVTPNAVMVIHDDGSHVWHDNELSPNDVYKFPGTTGPTNYVEMIDSVDATKVVLGQDGSYSDLIYVVLFANSDYVKVGSYTQSGSADITVSCGFKPKLLLCREETYAGYWSYLSKSLGLGTSLQKVIRPGTTTTLNGGNYVSADAGGFTVFTGVKDLNDANGQDVLYIAVGGA